MPVFYWDITWTLKASRENTIPWSISQIPLSVSLRRTAAGFKRKSQPSSIKQPPSVNQVSWQSERRASSTKRTLLPDSTKRTLLPDSTKPEIPEEIGETGSSQAHLFQRRHGHPGAVSSDWTFQTSQGIHWNGITFTSFSRQPLTEQVTTSLRGRRPAS